MLPNIAGFVGGDTVACMTAARFDHLEELTLLIDIGTNGEMVLGDRGRQIVWFHRRRARALGRRPVSPAVAGRGRCRAHVTLQDGRLTFHVIGDQPARGLCGSGLLDLISVLLERRVIDGTGHLLDGVFQLCPGVSLTQKDVREVQLAKGAIRAGIELAARTLGTAVEDIRTVYLAGAFGSYLTPASACRIGMIPPVLEERIVPIGNAAGEGAKLCAVSREEFACSQRLAGAAEFLELACLPDFQDPVRGRPGIFGGMRMKDKQLAACAQAAGFTHWASLDVRTLASRQEVRDMCAANTCGQYGRRWSCPPGCGSLEECAKKLAGMGCGILVQTVGEIEDSFNFDAMRKIEEAHKARFLQMYNAIRASGCDVLGAGHGAAPRCQESAYPKSPAGFRRKESTPWRPLGCWCWRSARQTACHITMALVRSPIPAASFSNDRTGQSRAASFLSKKPHRKNHGRLPPVPSLAEVFFNGIFPVGVQRGAAAGRQATARLTVS